MKSKRLSFIVISALTALLSGCGELEIVGARIKLVGEWEADLTNANVGTFGIDTEPSDNPFRNVVNSVVKTTAETLSNSVNSKERLSLKHDGTFVATMTIRDSQVAESKGTWSVVEAKGDDVTVSLKVEGSEELQKLVIKRTGEDQFEAPSVFGATRGNAATFQRIAEP